MSARVEYTDKAVKELKRLNRSDARRIVKKVGFYAAQKNPMKYAKRLRPPFDDVFRFRIGEYGVIFDMDDDGGISVLTVLGVKHRADAYR